MSTGQVVSAGTYGQLLALLATTGPGGGVPPQALSAIEKVPGPAPPRGPAQLYLRPSALKWKVHGNPNARKCSPARTRALTNAYTMQARTILAVLRCLPFLPLSIFPFCNLLSRLSPHHEPATDGLPGRRPRVSRAESLEGCVRARPGVFVRLCVRACVRACLCFCVSVCLSVCPGLYVRASVCVAKPGPACARPGLATPSLSLSLSLSLPLSLCFFLSHTQSYSPHFPLSRVMQVYPDVMTRK